VGVTGRRALAYPHGMANERARQLRNEMTDSERKLWRELSKRQLGGNRFRRQHPLGSYIIDFVCLSRRFIVEVDGGQHAEPAQQEYDARRTEWLEAQGYRVLRVSNTEVFDNLDGVAETIYQELIRRPSVARSRRQPRPPPPSRAE
jgi:very-short-patch-repair endonuclease